MIFGGKIKYQLILFLIVSLFLFRCNDKRELPRELSAMPEDFQPYQMGIIYPCTIDPKTNERTYYDSKGKESATIKKEIEEKFRKQDEINRRWELELEYEKRNAKQLSNHDLNTIYTIMKKEKIEVNAVLSRELIWKYSPTRAIKAFTSNRVNPNDILDAYYLKLRKVIFLISIEWRSKEIKEIRTDHPYFKSPEGVHAGMTLDQVFKLTDKPLVYENGIGYYVELPSSWYAFIRIARGFNPIYKESEILNNQGKIRVNDLVKADHPRLYSGFNDLYSRIIGR